MKSIATVLVLALSGMAQGAPPTLETSPHGKYWRYYPPTVKPQSPVLAVCHGMLGENDSAENVARSYMGVWLEFANKTGAALIAPVFSDRDFGAGKGCPHGWGYRGLYGRHIGADEFLHEIVDQLKTANPHYDGKLFLFGHSAGGQFVSHYVVMHPDRVHSAVISSPAWLPFPTMDDNWPRGLKPRKSVRRWPGEDQDQTVEIVPDAQKFLAAAQIPLLATAGALDLAPIRHNPSQGGDTHVARIQSWTKAMNELATRDAKVGNVTCVIVPNVGHHSGNISRASMPFMATQMQRHRQGQLQAPRKTREARRKR